jgi:hypothetical protein
MFEKNANETVQFVPFDDHIWRRALEMDVYERCMKRKVHREISTTSDMISITDENGENLAYLLKNDFQDGDWLLIKAGIDVSSRALHAASTLETIIDPHHPFWMTDRAHNQDLSNK